MSWEFAVEKNPAIDEHSKMPGILGLFDGNGFCWLGFVIRLPNTSIFHGKFGMIVLNHFFGIWENDD